MSKKAFVGQREGEEVELVFRRHKLTAVRGWVFLVIVGAIALAPLLITGDVRMFWVFVAGLAIGLIGLLYEYMKWHFSVYVVTNQRMRQISQRGVFRKTVVDLGLDKVMSVSYQVPGLKGGLFNYGTLLIQTQVGDMEIRMVPKPEEKYEQIQEIIGRVEYAEE